MPPEANPAQSSSPLAHSKAMDDEFQKVRDAVMQGAASIYQGASAIEAEVAALRETVADLSERVGTLEGRVMGGFCG